jgi:trehalose 6-phosphate phosphatase
MVEERPRKQLARNCREGTSIDVEGLDAVLLDLDGVITETATVHARAWSHMFDEYLRARAERLNGTFQPFDPKHDYERYVDGKPRYDGVASFLESRGIYLPPGEEHDLPDKETIRGLGNRKNDLFLEAIRQHGVDVYETSLDFMRRARSHDLKLAVVTSSRNCNEVLEAAGISGLFDAQVDGIEAREWMLAGKPAPDTYLEAARRLGVEPERAAVIEDAASGVQAGKAGHFGLVVGVSRSGEPELLEQSGADVVVTDLSELRFGKEDLGSTTVPPLALDRLADIRPRIENRRVAVFLDYDGTLTPIVERPDLAILSDDMRAALTALAEQCTIVVVSGRERHNVERLVGLNTIIYAGSHGFDIAGPKGTEIQHEEGASYVPVIAEAAGELERQLAPIEGVLVENKVYALAVHFRMVRPQEVGRVERIVDGVLDHHPSLRKTGGKKVFELRPGVDWDKGKAVLWLLDALGLGGPDVTPLYLGDDVTDEDAFAALKGRGLSFLVSDTPTPTAADYRLRNPGEARVFLEMLRTVLAGTRR